MLVEQPEAGSREALAQVLEALANPVRLALLEHLRTPKVLAEIAVTTPEEGPHRERSHRPISRQGVRVHLDRLLDAGVVQSRATERNRGPTQEYVVNHQRLFALAEELRSLASLRPITEPDVVTFPAAEAGGRAEIRGPCLVLVKGLDEGRLFDLASAGPREWTIGRRRGLPISLDYDPFVSSENTSIVHEAGNYAVRDLPESRNGTSVNFRVMAKGGRLPLRSGDLIGVGRSLLLFHG